MKNRIVVITKEILTPGLVGAMICLHAGLLVAMPASEKITTATEETVTVKEASSKKSATNKIEVAVGREFSLTLEANATTGYHWEPAAALDEAIVNLVSSTYQAPAAGLIGAGGKEIWTFRAVARGQTVIKLKYVRPWEKEEPPAQTASYQVTVR